MKVDHFMDECRYNVKSPNNRSFAAKAAGLLLFLAILPVASLLSQDAGFPAPPEFKPYKGIPGKVTKYNYFNYLDVRDAGGTNNRQAMGEYWELYFGYDSVFRQKKKFREFVVNQIYEKNGNVFFEDTTQVHFVVPADGGNVWGRLVLSGDKSYRLRLIKEKPFINKVVFDGKPAIAFDRFVDSVPLPPRVGYYPHSVVTRIQVSKFDHQEFTWNVKDTLYRQKVMGPFWDIKIDVRNNQNLVDKQVSTVEIMESYYRACTKANGKILKSRPRELLFTLPLDKAQLWVRVTVSLDGVYFVRAVRQSDEDRVPPTKSVVVAPPAPVDSTAVKTGGSDKQP